MLAIRLAFRELRSGLQGFRIFLACLALGVAAIAAVQSVSSGIVAGLESDGRAILGGDVSVRQIYTPPEGAPLDFLKASGRVSESAEMRGMARSLDEQNATLVELKAVDGAYPLYGAVELRDGGDLHAALANRDGVWGAVAEDTLLDRLGLKTGDRLRLGEAQVELRAVLASEPDKASSGTFALGPRLMVATSALPDTHLLQPGSIAYWTEKVALPAGSDAKAWKEELSRRFPDATWRVRDYTSASPQVETFIERMTLFLTLVGLTALLVGGVGVSNAVHAHLDSRAETIATLKCVGAPGALVFRTYLVQVMVLATLGIAIGLLLGGAAPLLLARLLEGVLPVSAHLGVYPKALGIAALFGFLTALTFSLWPLGRARQVPAGALFRDVIAPSGGRPPLAYMVALGLSAFALAALAVVTAADKRFALWFVGGAVATLLAFRGAAWLVTRGAARVGRPSRPGLRLALANLYRPGNPTASVVLSLGLGLTVLVAIALIEGNFARRINDVIPKDAPSFFFVDVQPDQFEDFKRTVLSVPGATKFEAVPSLRGRLATVNGVEAEKAIKDPERSWVVRSERGITYSAAPPRNGEIIAGSWWAEDYRGPPLLSIHKDVAEAFGIGVGDRIGLSILGRTIEAEVANVRAADFSTMAINFALVLSPGVLEAAPQTWIATVRAPQEREPELQRTVLQRFPNITSVRIKDALETVSGMLSHIGTAVRLTAAITLIAGTLVLAGAVAAGHRRRVYDSVVLKVLGATRKDVLGAFLMEYGLLGIVTALISGLIGTLTAWAILTRLMRWDWVFLPTAVLWTAALCTGITLVFGFLGTWRALGQPAAPLLRNE